MDKPFPVFSNEPPDRKSGSLEDFFKTHDKISDALVGVITNRRDPTIQTESDVSADAPSGAVQGLRIGLMGRWGSGKSFILNKLRQNLKRMNDNKPQKKIFVPIHVDLWLAYVHSINQEVLDNTYREITSLYERHCAICVSKLRWFCHNHHWSCPLRRQRAKIHWNLVKRQKELSRERRLPVGEFFDRETHVEPKFFGSSFLFKCVKWLFFTLVVLLFVFLFFQIRESFEPGSLKRVGAWAIRLIEGESFILPAVVTVLAVALPLLIQSVSQQRIPLFREANRAFYEAIVPLLEQPQRHSGLEFHYIYLLENIDRNEKLPNEFFDLLRQMNEIQYNFEKKRIPISIDLIVSADPKVFFEMLASAATTTSRSYSGADATGYLDKIFDMTVFVPNPMPQPAVSPHAAERFKGILDFVYTEIQRLFPLYGTKPPFTILALSHVDAIILTYIISLWCGTQPRGPRRFLNDLMFELRLIKASSAWVSSTQETCWRFLLVPLVAIKMVARQSIDAAAPLRWAELEEYRRRAQVEDGATRFCHFVARTSFIWSFCEPELWLALAYGAKWDTAPEGFPAGEPCTWWDSLPHNIKKGLVDRKIDWVFTLFAWHVDGSSFRQNIKREILQRDQEYKTAAEESVENHVGHQPRGYGRLGPIGRLMLFDTMADDPEVDLRVLGLALGLDPDKRTDSGGADVWETLQDIQRKLSSNRSEDRTELIKNWVITEPDESP
ncbi:MAG: hypothetical protein GVY36_17430 [Verrucomicrobia bacterium]|jgi:hypothetical protein|nr:hypothetical protein [Verrucomicrobiota bacterium]